MPATRCRRIARRAVMALAVAVLLPAWYVGAWLLWTCWAVRGVPTTGGAIAATPAFFSPIQDHIAAGRPGAGLLLRLRSEVFQRRFQPPAAPPEPDPTLKADIDRLLGDVAE